MTTSVALCTYNGEKFLKKQIDSILNQSSPIDEIVICDDGSTDNTLNILEDYKRNYPHIFKIHSNDLKLGSVKNFEKAISLCNNEIIFLSDQDDIWATDKVEDYILTFKKNTLLEVICSNGYIINEEDKIIDFLVVWDIIAEKKIKTPEKLNYFEIINYCGNFATGASIALKKSFIESCLPFPLVDNFHHDEWVSLVAASKDTLEFLQKKYFYYRKHDNQQVGGIFFEKNNKNYNRLLRFFQFDKENKSFSNYKHLLKRLSYSFSKNSQLFNNLSNTKHKAFTEENISNILNLYKKYRLEFKSNYPFLFFILDYWDKKNGKRQINL